MAEQTAPLLHSEKIINEDGTPTEYFLRQWQLQRVFNADMPSLQEEIDAIKNIDLIAGVGLDGGGDLSNGDRTFNLEDTGITPGAYTNVNITVDQQGRITVIANGTAGTGSLGVQKFTLSVNQNFPVGGTATIVEFDTLDPAYDNLGITIVNGVATIPLALNGKRIRVTASLATDSSVAAGFIHGYVSQNGTPVMRNEVANNRGFADIWAISGWQNVSTGDTFDFQVRQTDVNFNGLSAEVITFMQFEVLG